MDDLTKQNINQKAKEHLLDFIDQITPHFNTFFQSQKDRAVKISPIAVGMVERYENFIGGKRLRGALTKLGYDIYGGSETEDILKVASIIEFIHGFALMHDDIYDQDDVRRKNPAMHKQFENVFDEKYAESKRDKELYGISMATNLGDIGSYYSNIVLTNTNFPPELKLKFLKRLSEIVIQTVYGQAMDITFELDNVPLEERVMRIHEYKTAYYTISGPLQYGALLAGVDEKDERYLALEEYGIPVGIAFQLRDDELGMFSQQEKFGKPIFSDLRQGKNTLLFSKAFEKANEEQYELLYSMHGNSNVTEEDLKKVNQIIIDTGALEYSKNLSRELVKKGKEQITKITDDKKHQDLLDLIADFVITRDK